MLVIDPIHVDREGMHRVMLGKLRNAAVEADPENLSRQRTSRRCSLLRNGHATFEIKVAGGGWRGRRGFGLAFEGHHAQVGANDPGIAIYPASKLAPAKITKKRRKRKRMESSGILDGWTRFMWHR
jgi:hypothetical protein